jgi:hypothetical protein
MHASIAAEAEMSYGYLLLQQIPLCLTHTTGSIRSNLTLALFTFHQSPLARTL